VKLKKTSWGFSASYWPELDFEERGAMKNGIVKEEGLFSRDTMISPCSQNLGGL